MSYSDILRRNMAEPLASGNINTISPNIYSLATAEVDRSETRIKGPGLGHVQITGRATSGDSHVMTRGGATVVGDWTTREHVNEDGNQASDDINIACSPADENEEFSNLQETINIDLPAYAAIQLFGYNFKRVPSLIDNLKSKFKCVSDLNLFINKDMKNLTIYCHANQYFLAEIKREVILVLESAKKSADLVYEVPYFSSENDVSISIGRGAVVKNIEFDINLRTLLVFKKPQKSGQGQDSDALLALLENRDDIVSVHRFDDVPMKENTQYYLWGKIRCKDEEASHQIVTSTDLGSDDENVNDGWIAKRPRAKSDKYADGTVVKLSYFPDAASSFIVMMGPGWQSMPFPDKISLRGHWCKCSMQDPDSLRVDLSTIPDSQRTSNIYHLKSIVMDTCYSYLRRDPLSIESVNGEVTLHGFELGRFHKFVSSIASDTDELTKDNCRVCIKQKEGEVTQIITAEVYFDDQDLASAFIANIKGNKSYKTYRKCHLYLKYGVFIKKHITKPVYEATKYGLDVLRKSVPEKRNDMNVEIEEKCRGGALITVTGPSLRDVESVKKVLEKIISPQQIICLKDRSIRLIKGVFGQKQIRLLEKQLEVKIICDETRRTVNIYGPPNMKAKAYERLVLFLNTCNSETSVIDLCKFGINVRHLVASLMKQYGRFLEGLSSVSGTKDVYLDNRNYHLHVCGNHGNYKAAEHMETVLSYHVEQIKRQSNNIVEEVQCVACWCPIDTALYTLEFCGHAYCSECLEMQLSVATQTKEFPIRCAEDGCREEVTWNDITGLLRGRPKELQDLIQAAVSLFVAQNKDRFRHCVTADCSMVYRVYAWAESKRYKCPLCQTVMCRTCHVFSHEGMSCGMNMAQAHMDDKLREWLLEDTAKRAVCPKCAEGVEKNGGCQNVQCYTCKASICWRCKAHFEYPSQCYEHLSDVHDGIY